MSHRIVKKVNNIVHQYKYVEYFPARIILINNNNNKNQFHGDKNDFKKCIWGSISSPVVELLPVVLKNEPKTSTKRLPRRFLITKH